MSENMLHIMCLFHSELSALFEPLVTGRVKARVMAGKCYGFVEFASPEEADKVGVIHSVTHCTPTMANLIEQLSCPSCFKFAGKCDGIDHQRAGLYLHTTSICGEVRLGSGHSLSMISK